MTGSKPALRKLGRINQAYAYLNTLVNANSCEWITLSDDLDLEALERAIRAVIERHPKARSTTRRTLFGLRWQREKSLKPIAIERVELEPEQERGIEAIILQSTWERNVVSPSSHPFRFRYYRGVRARVLQIITSHLYTDGISANRLSAEIASAYTSLSQGRQPDLPAGELAETDHYKLFAAHLPLAQKLAFYARAIAGIAHDALAPFTRAAIPKGRKGHTEILRCEFSSVECEEARAHAKQKGYTLHPFLILALLHTIRQFNPTQGSLASAPLRIIDNFNLRRFGKASGIENLYDCAAVPFTLDIPLNLSDEAAIRWISDRYQVMKEGGAVGELFRLNLYYALSFALPTRLATRIACKAFTRGNIICSNIGIIDERLNHFGSVSVTEYYTFPQLFPPGDLMFQFSSFKGALRLVLLFDAGKMNRDFVQREFCDRYRRNLTKLTQPKDAYSHAMA